MKILVDVRKCVGQARCAEISPELFKLDDNGFNVTAVIQVPPGLEEQAREGANACPERVITIVEDETMKDSTQA